jgi:2-methylcitrate dehydratase PrpD
VTAIDRRTLLKLVAAGASGAVLGETAAAADASPAVAATVPAAPPAGGSLSEKIADQIVRARFEDLPPDVIQKAKEQIVFFFGRAFEASFADEGRQMRRVVPKSAPDGETATVIGNRLRLSPSDAAFANSALFSSKDDVLAYADIHAGVITLPTALAIGEARRVSGRELILALVLGYEVLGRLGRASLGWTAPQPRRSTNIFGGYGPVTVAGRLLKLDAERMAHAIGAGAHLCMGIAEGSMMQHYYSLIARNGTFAAQLVEAGAICYSRTTLEGELGLYRSFFGEVPPALPKLVEQFDYREILSAVQKRYSGTGHNTTPIEMFADELGKTGLTPQQVSKIEAVLPAKGARARQTELSSRGPFDPAQRAHSSLTYCLARVLLDGGIKIPRFDDTSIVNDTDVARVMQKIDIAFEPGHGPRWAKLTIHTTDGRKLERQSEFFTFDFPAAAWGEWLSASGKRLLTSEQLAQLLDLISNLERVDDVSRLLTAATPAQAVALPG